MTAKKMKRGGMKEIIDKKRYSVKNKYEMTGNKRGNNRKISY